MAKQNDELSDKQKQLLEIYGTFEKANHAKRKYALEEQQKYSQSVMKKLCKLPFVPPEAHNLERMTDFNEVYLGKWKFHTYRSKTNFTLSTLVKQLEKTAIWSEFCDLQEWYPDHDELALVFKCPANSFNDLVLVSGWADWLDELSWSARVIIDNTTVRIFTFKEMLEKLA